MKKQNTAVEMRRVNRSRVFRHLYTAQSDVTKQDIAYGLSLSLPTVTQNLQELLAEKLIQYSGTVQSTGGRRARSIMVVVDAAFAVGVSITADAVRIMVVNLALEEIAYRKYMRPFCNTQQYFEAVNATVEDVLDEFKIARKKLLGVGFTLPGIVDERTKNVIFAPTLTQNVVPLAWITQSCAYPCAVKNDASASGYAEWWQATEAESMAYLFIERGIGGVIVMGGKEYTGDKGRGGEFGHVCLMPNGRLCSCGQRGCLEAYCSTSRLSDDLGITLETFFERLGAGDAGLKTVWKEYLGYLARAIVNIHTMLDCKVVLGGIVVPFMQPYVTQLQQLVAALSLFDKDESYLHLCKYHARNPCKGAALYFISDFITQV